MDQPPVSSYGIPMPGNVMDTYRRWIGSGGVAAYFVVVLVVSVISDGGFGQSFSLLIYLVVSVLVYWVGVLAAAAMLKAPSRSASMAFTMVGGTFGVFTVATLVSLLLGWTAGALQVAPGVVRFIFSVLSLGYFIATMALTRWVYGTTWLRSFFLIIIAGIVTAILLLVLMLVVGFSMLGLIFGAFGGMR